MLGLAQLLRVPTIDPSLGFDISQDGQRIVFSWNKTGRWEIYELHLHASDSPRLVSGIREASSVQGAKFSPKYSPDDLHLAYAVDLDGSESFHIVLHNLKNNSIIDLTPDFGYAQQPNFDFSPDGKTLAILSDERGQFALYLLNIETGEKKLLLDLHHPIWDASWSPDGNWIAVEAESIASDHSIYVVSLSDNQKVFQLKLGNELLNAEHPIWSPDSKYLAFSGENGEWHDIGLFEIETQKITWNHESIGDDSQPTWSRSGECLGWVHSEGATTSFQFKKRGGDFNQIQIGDGFHSFPKFLEDNVVILYEDPNHPADLWKINLENGSVQQLTNSLPDELKEINFVQPEEICYKGLDGVDVPALLYRGSGDCAVIDIHGGPNWHVQFLWNPILSYMAARGWTVLVSNYRGSTGYGKKWQNASRFDMGGVDTNDCAAGVQYLIENKFANKNKIAVTGRSHGGYLTMTCMTMFPNLWAGGSAVVPFLNWIKSHYESREDLQHWNIENMGDPEKNHDLWVERSPYFFLDKINSPVQMICGGNDPRCPASDSIDARDKLVELGKEVELLLYQDEGHSFLNIDNVIDSELKRIEFLAKVLEK